jgi:predicted MFS family arabinose efflux permease
VGGALAQLLQGSGFTPLNSYRAVLMGYTLIGMLLVVLFLLLSRSIEAPEQAEAISIQRRFGLHKSKKVVFKLSSLFAMDAFAGGLVVQSMVAYWFNMKFGVQPAMLGVIFFAANILAGISALSAAWIAKRIGLINTMVYTHIPSNILLILVPFMPTLPLAILALLLRFSISQMDVPTRQSYTMAVVDPDERSAAMGVTSIARSLGAMLSPAITGQLLAVTSLIGAPFVIAGSIKIVYDVLIWRGFKAIKPPEER